MSKRWLPAAGLMILCTLAGCKTTATPDLEHPRSATVQQKRALRYDPYPENNVGTNMSDVRPREYQNPPAEPSQARWHDDPVTNANRWGTTGRE
jgi:hypothetical protein